MQTLVNVICVICIIIKIQIVLSQTPLYELDSSWESYKNEYSWSFVDKTTDETRRNIFLKNKRKIEAHNELYERGLVSYKLKMNKFGCWEEDEIISMATGLTIKGLDNSRRSNKNSRDNIQSDVPVAIDWRTQGAVTGVKNQGSCGSCWAFSTTGALEGQFFRKTGQLISFSEQNLIDCAVGNSGCTGGWMVSAFNHVKDHGIESEATYPLEKYNPQLNSSQCCANKCRYKSQNDMKVGIQEIIQLPRGDENELKASVSHVGPIAVAILAEGDFFLYEKGIYFEKNYNESSTKLNHAVLVTGYGVTEKGEEYWILKNSWGINWGLSGYMLLARNKGNNIGIATAASYPVLDMSH